jgi:hypothetical protein
MCDAHVTQTESRLVADKITFVADVTLVTQNPCLLLHGLSSEPTTSGNVDEEQSGSVDGG